jgi:diguanylate cyclase (GGDEF)-like protein
VQYRRGQGEPEPKMPFAAALRTVRAAGCIFAAALLLGGACSAVAAESADQLLRQADVIKYTNNGEFLTLLNQLDAQSGSLTLEQRDWIEYFHAWQLGYRGEYQKALAAFDTLIVHTQDETVRARARISLIYDQVNAGHFEDAFIVMGDVLESLPGIDDSDTRFLAFDAAAYVYSRGGEYDLALSYVNQALAMGPDGRSMCAVRETQIWILQEGGKLQPDDALIRQGLDACRQVGATANANSILLQWAKAFLDQDRPADALKLLEKNQAEVLATHSSALTSDFRSTMAQAYWRRGDLSHAREAAQNAVELANQQDKAKSVADAYGVLYQVAKQQGDAAAALAWHEKYATADKAYLNDVSARALAYQMVHQRVLDKQRQLVAATNRNAVLTLQQQVEAQKARTRLLYILLLLSGLLIVGGWAYRTKRSQMKFQKLARRDGLTGIFNRQHFLESAQDALRECAHHTREACLMVMDLDHFKSVNDMHGHAAGDDALKRTVATCQVLLRPNDVFGRLGGEEFAILVPDCPADVARRRAEAMRESIVAARREGDAAADVPVTASFGVASTRDCGYNLPTLLASADDAMYTAKRAGRNRVEVHRATDEPATAT